MKYEKFGLINTKQMLINAMNGGYAVPAFNFFNLETLRAIIDAANKTKSAVILSVSTSALKYVGGDVLMGMIGGLKLDGKNFALHLDHGDSFEACKAAIDMGFSSVMIDASDKPLGENIEITRRVVEYAKKHNVSVEAELGTLSGVEDENTRSDISIYTDPDTVKKFHDATDIDSLAVAIGTSHGGYKRKSDGEELRYDILQKIVDIVPTLPLVLHGASSIPTHLVSIINKNGGDLKSASGIPTAQILKTLPHHIAKINVDSDSRLAMTAAIREYLNANPDDFNPRSYLTAAINKMTDTYIFEIENIMKSNNKMV